MDNNFYIENVYAETKDLSKENIPDDTFGKLRVYRSAPESIDLQIRTIGSTNYLRGGVKRKIISNIRISYDDANNLINALKGFIAG